MLTFEDLAEGALPEHLMYIIEILNRINLFELFRLRLQQSYLLCFFCLKFLARRQFKILFHLFH